MDEDGVLICLKYVIMNKDYGGKMMKKIILVLACFFLFGCNGGGKSVDDPEEIYTILKERGMTIDATYTGNAFIANIKLDDSYDVMYIYNEDETANNLFIGKDNGMLTVSTYSGKDATIQMSIDKCVLDSETWNELSDGNKCSETDISDSKILKKEIISYFDEMGLTPESVSDMCEWYIEQNGDDIKSDF
ncbi:hypothetical protein MKC54_03005 [[Clostridium] innocuum]|nr:hypothetical protein [[Clostridium] innocuum]MCR0575843.1 hypothetical protein [[Clostridium] innocuum]